MHGERGAAAGHVTGGDTAPSRCTTCGGAELRLHRKTVRAHFGGRDVRIDVDSYECRGCGELHFRGAGPGGVR